MHEMRGFLKVYISREIKIYRIGGIEVILEEAIRHCEERAKTCDECGREHKQLAEWLRELQQYKKIGTVEECREAASIVTKAERNELAKIIDDWLKYQKIGTVEECREAVEKQRTKEPVIGADFMVGRDDDGNPIWAHDYVCPECGMGIAGEYICCPYCGTYVDWSKGGIE